MTLKKLKYTKPEIASLGQTARAIGALPGYPAKNDPTFDEGAGSFMDANPAYDLDE